MSLENYKEALSEHNSDSKNLEYHTKESVLNLYKNLLELANELLKELSDESLDDMEVEE